MTEMTTTATLLKTVADASTLTVVACVDEGDPLGYREYGATVLLSDLVGKTGPQKAAIVRTAVAAERAKVLAMAQRPQADLPPTLDLP